MCTVMYKITLTCDLMKTRNDFFSRICDCTCRLRSAWTTQTRSQVSSGTSKELIYWSHNRSLGSNSYCLLLYCTREGCKKYNWSNRKPPQIFPADRFSVSPQFSHPKTHRPLAQKLKIIIPNSHQLSGVSNATNAFPCWLCVRKHLHNIPHRRPVHWQVTGA